MKIVENNEYVDFLREINDRIREAQLSALRAVNKELIMLYWDIGRRIVEKQKTDKWGDEVIEGLAKDLQNTFPGMKGFSARNLWRMRDLYVSYAEKAKLSTLLTEISWSHNIAILGKCEDDPDIFTFVGSQYRLEVDNKEYFIDILLYHRSLRCLVAIELKIGVFIPEYVGKMQFYLSALDDRAKMAGENPSIGIILCKSKSKMTVEYALKDSQKPIGVATYSLVKKLPKELKDQLPTAEQIARLMGDIE